VLAFVLAIVAETLRMGSRIREAARHIRNKVSEHSTTRLRKRISELEASRAIYMSYSSSDKALYLATLKFVLGILGCICAGVATAAIDRLRSLSTSDLVPANSFSILALMFFALGIIIGIQGTRIAALDTQSKILETIHKLDGEISALRQKLIAIDDASVSV
jgi:hypothetical protein